jgi:hypothetical protein
MTKINWVGWHQFESLPDFMRFIKANHNVPYTKLIWVNTDCPIVIWLN